MNEEVPVYLNLIRSPEICLVDINDYFRIKKMRLKFYIKCDKDGKRQCIYSSRKIDHKEYSLADFILGYKMTKSGFKFRIDHIDRNYLNNLPSNLRHTSISKNIQNSVPRTISGYKGVRKMGDKWQARISFKGETIALGVFDTILEAAIAYDVKALELYGSNAFLNFPTIKVI